MGLLDGLRSTTNESPVRSSGLVAKAMENARREAMSMLKLSAERALEEIKSVNSHGNTPEYLRSVVASVIVKLQRALEQHDVDVKDIDVWQQQAKAAQRIADAAHK